MKKYLVMLFAAVLLAAAPAYYAIQSYQNAKPEASAAGVEAKSSSRAEKEAKVDCSSIAKGAAVPAPCIEASAGKEAGRLAVAKTAPAKHKSLDKTAKSAKPGQVAGAAVSEPAAVTYNE